MSALRAPGTCLVSSLAPPYILACAYACSSVRTLFIARGRTFLLTVLRLDLLDQPRLEARHDLLVRSFVGGRLLLQVDIDVNSLETTAKLCDLRERLVRPNQQRTLAAKPLPAAYNGVDIGRTDFDYAGTTVCPFGRDQSRAGAA